MNFSDLLMFLGKLVLGALIVYLVLGVLLPLIGINASMAAWALLLTAGIWAVWTLRKGDG